MSKLEDYGAKYENLRMERDRGGVLRVTMHTDGAPLVWSPRAHREFGEAFADIAADPENSVVILSGTGEAFCAGGDAAGFAEMLGSPKGWTTVYGEGRRLYERLMDIPIPLIGVINGPARGHAALGLLCDVVLAADDAVFQDGGHFDSGVVPGDGVHILWPLLLGMNRGRYFLLMGQEISAAEALALGVVNEVMPRAELDQRVDEVASQLTKNSQVTLRLTRAAITLQLRRLFQSDLGYGLALEALGGMVPND